MRQKGVDEETDVANIIPPGGDWSTIYDRICVVRNLGIELDRYPNRTSAGLIGLGITIHVTELVYKSRR
ncbi:hypothetical protein N7513_011237 [Penicillium frequentans]|nr:hypothetical protein N7513_011237 [Penicillium glabrum]